MSTPQEETYRSLGRGSFHLIPPEHLTIVTNPKHVLFDDRVHLPIVEELVLNIMHFGVKKPVIIRLNGKDKKGDSIIEVVDGRQRVKHAVEANKRLKDQGKQQITVKCIAEKGEDADFIGTMVITNEFHQARSVMSKVRLVKRLMDIGKTRSMCALVLGVSEASISNYMKLLDCSPEVQDAVDKGIASTETAKVLSTMSREDQKAALKKMVAKGATKGRAGINAAQRAVNGEEINGKEAVTIQHMRKRGFIEYFLEASREDYPEVSASLGFILGDDSSLDEYPEIFKLIEDAPGSRRVERPEKKVRKGRRPVEELD